MKKLLMGVLALFMGALGICSLAAPVSAAELGEDPICEMYKDDPTYADVLKEAGCNIDVSDGSLTGNMAQTIINLVIAVVGVLAVIFMIIGGITYMTSQGDPTKTKRGRDTLIYALLGAILAGAAYTIVNWVLAGLFSEGTPAEDNSVIMTQRL